MDTYTSQRTMQYNYNGGGWNNNRLSLNGSYNRAYIGFNVVNGRNRNNGYNNGGGNGTTNGYDNSDRNERKFRPPREWRSFSEIKFKVSNNVHTYADVTDLMGAFSAYGSVYRVEIITEETK